MASPLTAKDPPPGGKRNRASAAKEAPRGGKRKRASATKEATPAKQMAKATDKQLKNVASHRMDEWTVFGDHTELKKYAVQLGANTDQINTLFP